MSQAISLRNRHAFVDEYGTPELDISKEGVSSHFILAAAIFDRNSLGDQEIVLDGIRRKHFQTGEMKSSNIGKNHDRRLRVLRDLLAADFRAYVYVIDKSRLYSEGLRYKRVFYKFINGQLDADLYTTFPGLRVTADDLGSEEFKASFVNYIRTRHMPDLFDQSEFGFSESKNSVFVQLADIIAGTVARGFDASCFTQRHREFMQALAPRMAGIVEWPLQSNRVLGDVEDTDPNADVRIAEAAVQAAEHYVAKHSGARDPERLERLSTVRYLLFNFQFVDPNRFITADEMIESISYSSSRTITKQHFMQRVIAPLRDAGILIASSNKGYKIPGSQMDLDSYVAHTQTVVLPMLKRLRLARNRINLATGGDYDILRGRELLKAMVEGIETSIPWHPDEVSPEDVST